MKKIWTYIEPFLPIILGGIVGFIISGFMDYQTLDKPPLSPPGWIFPVVWTILYILLGVSFYLVNRERKTSNTTYYINLFVNLFWPIIFFVFKLYILAFFWLLLLLVWTIKLLREWKEVSLLAYRLQIPYLVWLIFAAYLNLGVAILN